eukprot:CAMPEP_0196587474 /NCGR_PEP_ID=MMETSP1081-20130531/57588_1 /TAXON_ID=36882 /ORGANISM="Pyramimonas amylifera, Strain CCMP720" /LENGTH=139 /DNA_ID=CAMNT_0041909667 /DNA_START=1 /DNA_END=417 /DNA_ORIENTATION=+
MMNELLNEFITTDKLRNKVALSGVLPKKQILRCVKDCFKHKLPEQMKDLSEALDQEEQEKMDKKGEIKYHALFEEDKNYDQGPFAECLRDQQLTERKEYLEELESALFNQSYDDDKICQERAGVAFRQADPDIDENRLR